MRFLRKLIHRKGNSIPFGYLMVNEYTFKVNALLFFVLGAKIIWERGLNALNLSRTYDWSQRIFLLYGMALIAFGISIFFKVKCNIYFMC